MAVIIVTELVVSLVKDTLKFRVFLSHCQLLCRAFAENEIYTNARLLMRIISSL